MWNSRKYREFKEEKNGNLRKKREFKEKKLEPWLEPWAQKKNTTNKIKYKEVKYLKKNVCVFQKLRKQDP